MEIKTYTKQELASMYFPDADPEVARVHLWRWIVRCKELHSRLTAMSVSKHAKFFTPRQVAAIVDFLGEP